MNKKKTNTVEMPPFGPGRFLTVAALVFFLLLWFTSCKTVKQSQSATESEGSKTEFNLDSLIRAKMDSVRKQEEERRRSLGVRVDFAEQENELMKQVIEELQSQNFITWSQKDSLLKVVGSMNSKDCPERSVEITPGGGLKVSGPGLRSVQYDQSEYVRKLDSMSAAHEFEVNEKLRWQDSANHYKQAVSAKSKTSTKFPWWLFFAGAAAGFLLRPLLSKLIFAIKTYLNGTKANT